MQNEVCWTSSLVSLASVYDGMSLIPAVIEITTNRPVALRLSYSLLGLCSPSATGAPSAPLPPLDRNSLPPRPWPLPPPAIKK